MKCYFTSIVMTELSEFLTLLNPWWSQNTYIPSESALPKRQDYARLWDLTIQTKQVVSITGLRRIGKTTIMRQMIANLLKTVHPKRILFASFDQPIIETLPETITSILKWYGSEILAEKFPYVSDQTYIFLDEIQQIPQWQDIVKRYYDLTDKVKFVVSGSSSAFLRPAGRESLAGRIFDLTVHPLSYTEFLRLSPSKTFDDYLRFGQFPELLNFPSNETKVQYLRDSIIAKVLDIDIPTIVRIRNKQQLDRLFWTFMPNVGQIVNFPKLIRELGIPPSTFYKYLHVLSDSLLVHQVVNGSGSFRSEKRLLRKIYPSSSNFLSLYSPVPSMGFFAETYVAEILLQTFQSVQLWHDRGKEVDFYLPDKHIAIEIKYQDTIHADDVATLYRLGKKRKNIRKILVAKKGFRSTINDVEMVPIDELEDTIKKW